MSVPFQRSLRALNAESARPLSVALSVAAVFAVAWGWWFCQMPIWVYAVSGSARVEAEQAAHPVQSAVLGRVVATWLQLGRTVAQGEPLVELDSRSLRLELAEKNARLHGLEPQIAAIAKEIIAKRSALEQQRRVFEAQSAEAQARQREANVIAIFSEAETVRGSSLRDLGALSEVELERRRSSSGANRAAADAQHGATLRSLAEERVAEGRLQAEIAELERTQGDLAGQHNMFELALVSLAHQIDLRTIRAPIDGQLGEVAALQVGTVLQEAALVAAVVPHRELRVVAEFAPAAALGRIRPQQSARLRLTGFPWAQYGTVQLTVTRVGSELRNNQVRVELAIVHGPESGLILQHGLPGAVEVSVERVTPLVLTLRTAGRIVSAQAADELFTRNEP